MKDHTKNIIIALMFGAILFFIGYQLGQLSFKKMFINMGVDFLKSQNISVTTADLYEWAWRFLKG